MNRLKFKNVGDRYRTTEPIINDVYGYVQKNENDFGANVIWGYGLCKKDGEVIEAIMTTDTKKQAVKELQDQMDTVKEQVQSMRYMRNEA